MNSSRSLSLLFALTLAACGGRDLAGPTAPQIPPAVVPDSAILLRSDCPGWIVFDVFVDGKAWSKPGELHAVPNGASLRVAVAPGMHLVALTRWTLPINSYADSVASGTTFSLPCN